MRVRDEAEILAEGREYRLTRAQRIAIVSKFQGGIGKKRIAQELRISVNSVKLWISRFDDDLNLEPHVNEDGRPRTTDEEEDFMIACSGN